jgi:hypothetical protein
MLGDGKAHPRLVFASEEGGVACLGLRNRNAHPRLAFASEGGGVGAGRRFVVGGCCSSK